MLFYFGHITVAFPPSPSPTLAIWLRNVASRQRRHFTSSLHPHGDCRVVVVFKSISLFFIFESQTVFLFLELLKEVICSGATHWSRSYRSNYFLRIRSSAFGGSRIRKRYCDSLWREVFVKKMKGVH